MPKRIARIEIRNLQSHEDTTLDLHPGVNMITGENGAGKSAVFRAIRLLAYNRPVKGLDGMVRKGKTSILVKVTMEDGSWVVREKGKDINRYVCFDEAIAAKSGGPLTLDAVGTDVPEEVPRILGIGLAKLGNDMVELGMARQMDPAFLLSQSEPDVARWLYALTNLDEVRGAIDLLNKDHRAEGTSIKDREGRIVVKEQEAEKFVDLDSRIAYNEALSGSVDSAEAEIGTVFALGGLFRELSGLRDRAVPTVKRVKELEEAVAACPEEALEGLRTAAGMISALEGLGDDLAANVAAVAASNDAVKMLSHIRQLDVDAMGVRADEMSALWAAGDSLDDVGTKISRCEKDVEGLQTAIGERESAIAAEKSSFTMGDEGGIFCPVCGSEIEGSVMDHILEESGSHV